MKRLFALLLAFSMIFALAACSGDPSSDKPAPGGDGDNTPGGEEKISYYEVFTKAMSKTLSADSYEIDLLNQITYESNGSFDYEEIYDMNLKAVGLKTENPTAMLTKARTVNNSTGNRTDDMNGFYADGWWYFYERGFGRKWSVPFEQFMQETLILDDLNTELPKKLFDNPKVTERSDGGYSLMLTVDEATMETVFRDIIVKLVANEVWDGDLTQVLTKNGTITITIFEGRVRDFSVSFGCAVDKEGYTKEYTVTRSIEYVSWNEEVTLTPFEYMDTFTEVDW